VAPKPTGLVPEHSAAQNLSPEEIAAEIGQIAGTNEHSPPNGRERARCRNVEFTGGRTTFRDIMLAQSVGRISGCQTMKMIMKIRWLCRSGHEQETSTIPKIHQYRGLMATRH